MTETENSNLWTEIKLCLGLLTRLPVNVVATVSPSVFARSSRWFPMVGALVGMQSAATLFLGILVGLPNVVAVLIAIGFSILLTGALHEDGLADVADGFGGGANRDAKLEIMRDSRVGTYGVLALTLAVGLKGALLVALMNSGLWAAAMAMIVAASASRLTPVILMNRLPMARNDGMAVTAGKPEAESVRTACGLALASLLVLTGWQAMLVTIIATLAACAAIGALARRQIGGQTGDVLGAGQQVTEICVLIGLLAVGP
jgi:adenosylcobinamide-GDP ribazoletransferase